ncbi:MAG: prolyl oligopeptidase family serine peptidase [Phycisphaerae bacterium]|nr:prolyl oligopeptidase family serine peptidase [Phycisphaerae bacterium]
MRINRLTKSWMFGSVAAIALALGVGCSQTGARYPNRPLVYPKAKTVDVVEDYHGTKLADPYRWMEDLDSPELKQWIDAENKVTFGYLAEIPVRDRIRARLTKLWDFERYDTPFKEGGRYFFRRNDGLQNQSVLYTVRSLDESPRVLIDPNTLSKDGTVALAGLAVTDDARYLAYALADAGSDWQRYRVRDIETGDDLPDEICWVKFSGASWTKDGKGFFYSRYDEPKGENKLKALNHYHKLYYHRLGDPQSSDTLVYERPDQKEWGFGGEVTEDGKYLVITVWQGTEQKNRVYYKDLAVTDARVIELLNDFDAEYNFIGNDGPVFWFQTDLKAPRGRVIAIDTRQPDRTYWRELIPQSEDTLLGVRVVGDRFIATYLKDAHSRVKFFGLDGTFQRDLELPGIGSVGGFTGKRGDTETFYSYTSFATPTTVYRYDFATAASSVFRRPNVDIRPDDYIVRQVFYTSKDGTRIPMFITHRRDVTLNGKNPTLLYGYGGFKAPMTPSFSVSRLVWLEMGGVFALANIRGGGEYGQEWHDAGRLAKKQNCFDDFIAAAEWLIANKYTSREKLAINGGSNGGLLVGACMTQRPDLFGAIVAQVGVMDMLRFHKFTIGWGWVSDYGSADDPEQFRVLHSYSPLHNLRPGTKYPATLITTGDHDDRVVPSHSFKFAAALQEAHAGDAPVLIRVETRAGHGAGKPTAKIIEEQSDIWAFLVRVLGVDDSRLRV